ncbi:hypothetical protein ABW20_dc0103700 [Dactylellina cionopaga]|nr:hypothetical protein ABW20_dc0103700 [Dactylellina cionopaga]
MKPHKNALGCVLILFSLFYALVQIQVLGLHVLEDTFVIYKDAGDGKSNLPDLASASVLRVKKQKSIRFDSNFAKLRKRASTDSSDDDSGPIRPIDGLDSDSEDDGTERLAPGAIQEPQAEAVEFESPRLFQFYGIRTWKEIVTVGHSVRAAEPPAEDISKEGSKIVMNPKNNYRYLAGDFKYNPEPDNWLPGIEVLTGFGQRILGKIKQVVVYNPERTDEKEIDTYKFSIAFTYGAFIIHQRFKNYDQGQPVEQMTSEILWRAWYEEVSQLIQKFNKDKLKLPWKRPQLKDLKYISMEKIQNTETSDVIRQSFNLLGKTKYVTELRSKAWDGLLLDSRGFRLRVKATDKDPIAQEVFSALIGSRNGKGPARLLFDHWHALGGKQVIEIIVWRLIESSDPSMAYKLGKLPAKYKLPGLPEIFAGELKGRGARETDLDKGSKVVEEEPDEEEEVSGDEESLREDVEKELEEEESIEGHRRLIVKRRT